MPQGDLDRRLAELAAPVLDDLRAERVRRRASELLREAKTPADQPSLAAIARFWNRYAAPTLLAGATAVYLAWALQAAAGLYR